MEHEQTSAGAASFRETAANHNVRLTSAEIAQLWMTFMQYTLLSCVFRYFVESAKDPAIKNLMADTLSRFGVRITFISETFAKENIPAPMGFGDEDVNLSAPALFSEVLMLHYLRNMIRVGMTVNSLNLNMATRPDVRDFYSRVLESTIRLNAQTTDFMLSKGILSRPPIVTISDRIEHVQRPDFLGGLVAEKRPLLTTEIAHLYHNVLTNQIGRVLLVGFRQVASNQDVRDYFGQGTQLADSIIDSLTKIARDEQVNFSILNYEDVSSSTEAPFSDKLMMFHIDLINSIGAGMYGVSLAASARHDLMREYGKIMLEVGMYTEKGIKLMIDHAWLEEPPQIVNREALSAYTH